MKNLVISVLVVVISVISLLACAVVDKKNDTIAKACEVVEVEEEVVVIDENGNLWGFFGDGYEVGQTITVYFEGDEIVNAE